MLAGCEDFKSPAELLELRVLLLMESDVPAPRPVYVRSFWAALKRLLQLIGEDHPQGPEMAAIFLRLILEVERQDYERRFRRDQDCPL